MSKLTKLLFALTLSVLASGPLLAQTFPGYPLSTASPNTNPLTGNETIPADTNLGSGLQPQTELVTPSALAMYSAGSTITYKNATDSATAGTVTASVRAAVINTGVLATANGSNYSLTVTNTLVTAASLILVSVGNGGNTTVGAVVMNVTPGAGSFVVQIGNRSGSAALNGSLKVSFFVLQ